MPTVYVRADPKHRTRFHRDPECRQLTKPPSRGEHYPLVAMDLEEVYYRPCQTCYPDVPRVKIHKAYCPVCKTKNACPHNGGERIVDRRGRSYWVWPDTNSIHFYRSLTQQHSST